MNEERPVCSTCGGPLSDGQVAEIRKLNRISRAFNAKAQCDACWAKDNPEAAAARKRKEDEKRERQRAREEAEAARARESRAQAALDFQGEAEDGGEAGGAG